MIYLPALYKQSPYILAEVLSFDISCCVSVDYLSWHNILSLIYEHVTVTRIFLYYSPKICNRTQWNQCFSLYACETSPVKRFSQTTTSYMMNANCPVWETRGIRPAILLQITSCLVLYMRIVDFLSDRRSNNLECLLNLMCTSVSVAILLKVCCRLIDRISKLYL